MRVFSVLLILIWLVSCSEKEERAGVVWKNIEKKLQSQLIMAKPGDTIFLEPGYFWFTRSLLIEGKSNVVIKGAGIDKTILSFKGQEEGAEGIKIANCRDIELTGFTVEDAKGDNIKVSDTDGIYFKSVKTYWTGGAKETNGAYGLYPVLCKNVLIEECIAARASDAGIYVGQSDSVIIRRNIVYENVAGIESENSNFVDIYDNHAYNNTGGILVFDLPGLTQYGSHTRVFNNLVERNNHRNFAPKGNIVGMVPPGTGVMLLATRAIEIFNNQILNNRTTGIALASYELVLAMDDGEAGGGDDGLSIQTHNNNYALDTLYNPYIHQVFIRNNEFQNKYLFPTMKSDFGKLLLLKSTFKTPHILFDGFSDVKLAEGKQLCIDQDPKIQFLNINAPNDLKNMSRDVQVYNCRLESLSEIVLRDRFKMQGDSSQLSNPIEL